MDLEEINKLKLDLQPMSKINTDKNSVSSGKVKLILIKD